MKKLIFYIFSSIIFIGFVVFSTNFLIQIKLNESVKNKEGFLKEFVSFLKPENEELGYSYLNANFHIFQGLKVHKLKFELKNKKDYCKIENLYIYFKLTSILKTLEAKSINIENLECEFYKKTNFYYLLNQIFDFIMKYNLNINIKGISFNDNLKAYQNIKLNLTPEKEKVIIYGNWRSENQSIRIFGSWLPYTEKNRIYFEFQNLLIKILIDNTVERFKLNPTFKIFQIKSNFYLNGKGSIDITPLGFANNVYGKLYNFELESGFINAKNITGEFHYSYIEAFQKDYLKEVLNFKNNMNEIKFVHEKEDQFYNSNINLKMNIDNHLIKTDFNSKGGVELNLNLESKNKNISIQGNFNLEKFILLQKKSQPNIFIKKAEFTTISPNHFYYFINGTINSLDFNYSGNINYYYDKVPSWVIKGNFDLLETNYQIIFDMLYEFYKQAKIEAEKKDAKKYQDLGPAWENKFYESDLYKNFIKNINFETKINLINATQKNLPTIKGLLQLNEQRLQMNLNGDYQNSWIRMSYSIDFLQMIPVHNFYVNLNLYKPAIELSFFCNQCKESINKIIFEYSSTSNGLYYKDIYLNNSSNLKFEVDSIFINNDYRIELIEKLMNINLKNKLIKLKLQYSSSGIIYNPILIELESDEYYIRGNGSYSLIQGGTIKCYFQNKQERFYRDFSFIIRKDSIWIPSYLY